MTFDSLIRMCLHSSQFHFYPWDTLHWCMEGRQGSGHRQGCLITQYRHHWCHQLICLNRRARRRVASRRQVKVSNGHPYSCTHLGTGSWNPETTLGVGSMRCPPTGGVGSGRMGVPVARAMPKMLDLSERRVVGACGDRYHHAPYGDCSQSRK